MQQIGSSNQRMAGAQRSRAKEALTGPRNTKPTTRTFDFSTDLRVPFTRVLSGAAAKNGPGNASENPPIVWRPMHAVPERLCRGGVRHSAFLGVFFLFLTASTAPLGFRSTSPDPMSAHGGLRTQFDTGRSPGVPSIAMSPLNFKFSIIKCHNRPSFPFPPRPRALQQSRYLAERPSPPRYHQPNQRGLAPGLSVSEALRSSQ